jgi:hypothetical protein
MKEQKDWKDVLAQLQDKIDNDNSELFEEIDNEIQGDR